jgi:hypothetical protein
MAADTPAPAAPATKEPALGPKGSRKRTVIELTIALLALLLTYLTYRHSKTAAAAATASTAGTSTAAGTAGTASGAIGTGSGSGYLDAGYASASMAAYEGLQSTLGQIQTQLGTLGPTTAATGVTSTVGPTSSPTSAPTLGPNGGLPGNQINFGVSGPTVDPGAQGNVTGAITQQALTPAGQAAALSSYQQSPTVANATAYINAITTKSANGDIYVGASPNYSPAPAPAAPAPAAPKPAAAPARQAVGADSAALKALAPGTNLYNAAGQLLTPAQYHALAPGTAVYH